MEDTAVVKGIFFYTKKLDSELMVRCLQTMLNYLPSVKFTSIIADEKFLGYRVHFSSPGEETVLKTLQLVVSGHNIHICPLKTCLGICSIKSVEEVLSESDIADAIERQFGKLLDISPISSSSLNVESFRASANIPEIKALEIFQREGSLEMLLPLPNKKIELKVTLCCSYCKKDGHVTRDCHQTSVAGVSKTSTDGESVFADSTMKMDNFESTETYAERIGREEIMKTEYFSENKPEKKELKQEPENSSSAGVPDEIRTILSHKEAIYSNSDDDDDNDDDHKENTSLFFMDDDDDDEVQMISCKETPKSSKAQDLTLKTETTSTDEESNPPMPEFPGPSNRRRQRAACTTVVEDMNVLSESFQECINNACEKFGIISREKLQAFFHHVKKKSNVLEVAEKFVPDVIKLKELLQEISRRYYNTTKVGTKEDKRFIKWLAERIEKFDKKQPQKRKRTSQSNDNTPSKR